MCEYLGHTDVNYCIRDTTGRPGVLILFISVVSKVFTMRKVQDFHCSAATLWVQVNRYKFGHGLQLPAHSCSVRLMRTTHFQLLRTQGHAFSYSSTPLAAKYKLRIITNNYILQPIYFLVGL
jgi:hypothetical protein